MRPVALSDAIAVGEVPTREEISILAKAGFRSLLNVQPDGEVERLPSADEIGKAAVAAGIAYAATAIESRRPDDDSIAAFGKTMSELPLPIYACCYSGARAAAAWALAMAPSMMPSAIAAACAGAGYDMSALQADLERRHAGIAAAPASPLAAAPVAAEPVATPPVQAVQMPVTAAPQATGSTLMTSAAAAVAKSAEMIVFPRAATAGGFAVSG